MGLWDKLKQLTTGRGASEESDRPESDRPESGNLEGRGESLPGGSSGKEAAEADPARAAELAD
jgi:hypothetical protein